MRARKLCWLGLLAFGAWTSTAWAEEENFLKKLYKLVWPIGRFEGDLSKTIVRNTEKSGGPGGTRRMYAVHTTAATEAGVPTWEELDNARGASDPVVCPDGKQFYYRRGATVLRATLLVTSGGVLDDGEGAILKGVAASRLYACVVDKDGKLSLWAETKEEAPTVRLLQPGSDAWFWTDVPSELGVQDAATARKVATYLALMRSVRPDETSVLVRDGRLVQRTKAGASSLLVDNGHQFRGNPQWVGETRWVIASGMVVTP